MSEELLIQHCAPTLAGIKTGSLVTAAYETAAQVLEQLRQWNRRLTPKGVRIIPLRFTKAHVLLYIFRADRLETDLQHTLAERILQEKGYTCRTTGRCLAQLMENLQQGDEFPHEIGLFLGYPPKDVQGFIHNKAGSHKLCGCWKVYDNVEQAKKIFAQYRNCTKIYVSQWQQGKSLEYLTVAS